jgi:phenylpropionate dioxygenase-like ring-hydroxylating dioxygenase large terminal subunit
MLTREHNELLTRIGPGTPMGDMLREYWVPACRSAKLERDGAPERIRLFSENFVAFRVTDGRVGFIAEGCPHRCASMALARNEGNGLRCIFHGWKVSVDGECVDAPTEPEERRAAFAKKVPVRSHPVHEAGGMVWVYLGKQATPPRFPDFEFNNIPDSHVRPMRAVIHCNWLQGLEALLDSAHVGFLHNANVQSFAQTMIGSSETTDILLTNGAPNFEFLEQPYGFREGALRPGKTGKTYARIREVALPYFSFIPGRFGGVGTACCSIPIDDEHTAQWYIGFNVENPIDIERYRLFGMADINLDFFNEGMGGWHNMWQQDRKAMANGYWSGFVGKGNPHEDFAVQESMGPIVDRSMEHLGQADLVIVRARRMLIDAVRRYQKTGEISFHGSEVNFARIRALAITYPSGDDWKKFDAFDPAMAAAE